MTNKDFELHGLEIGFPGVYNGSDTKEEENVAGQIITIPGTNPISKADRMRERTFRNRINNSNKKYLKPYLKG